MAKKKFLQENGTQVWPISRADCIYTEEGKLLSEDYASKDYVDEIIEGLGSSNLTDAEIQTILEEVFETEDTEYSITDEEMDSIIGDIF